VLTRRSHSRAADERGFKLIEVLVAMVTGLVVAGALFAILEVSMKQSTQISDVAQATQLGRGTMTHVVDELRSACVSSKFKPVQSESTESKLVFVNGYSESAEVPAVATTNFSGGLSGVRKDEIVWSGVEGGTLTDNVALGNGESAGSYTFKASAPVRIGNNIRLAKEVVKGKEETAPLYTYYEYAETPATSTSAASSTLTKIALSGGKTLGTAAERVAAVSVDFNAAAPGTPVGKELNKTTEHDRSVNLNSAVTFAFSAPNSEATIKAGPCE